jgi:hypothetical protein
MSLPVPSTVNVLAKHVEQVAFFPASTASSV